MLTDFTVLIWKFQNGISQKLTWQVLGSIGRSNLAKVTILAPFVGYLLVFNPSFDSFFTSSIPVSASLSEGGLGKLHDLRLVFLYFGLIFLGLGVLFFNAFCPAPIRRFPLESEYILEMESVKSASLVASRLDSVISYFLVCNLGESRHPSFLFQSPSFPTIPSSYLHDLVAQILSDLPEKDRMHPSSDEPIGTFLESSPHAISAGDGLILTDEVMTRMFESVVTADVNYHRFFRQNSFAYSRQVFFVDYVSSNHSAFTARVFVFVLFLFGFLSLSIPSVTTSILVLSVAVT